jgi:mono/diheme cytochrome c family protein
MKSFFKVVGIILLVIVALAAIGVSYLLMRKPAQRPASTEKIEATPERVARGRYVVQHVSACFDCHSERVLAYALPFKPGREGVGGFIWDAKVQFPGTVGAANLTPDPDTGLGRWTDGEILRAIREGVDREGKALFPLMPYGHYRAMSDDDGKAVVAYLRTLAPLRYTPPKKALNPPLNIIEKFIPKPLDGPVPTPSRANTIEYGYYLSQIGACHECHTPKGEKGEPIPGKDLAGGWEMHTPFFRVVTANITPHPSTWMGQATKEQFIARFRSFSAINASNAPQAEKGRNTVMPWLTFSGMTDEDLGALYDYLKSVPPIENKVNPFPDAASPVTRSGA